MWVQVPHCVVQLAGVGCQGLSSGIQGWQRVAIYTHWATSAQESLVAKMMLDEQGDVYFGLTLKPDPSRRPLMWL